MRMLNNFEMRIFRRDVRHIDIEKNLNTSVGLASARPSYSSVTSTLVAALEIWPPSKCRRGEILRKYGIPEEVGNE